jgi:hypothetical protein
MLGLLVIAACSFDRKELDSRECIDSEDCEPDEDCTKNVCLQRPCQTPSDCGSSYAFACTSGGCLIHDCEADTECGAGLTCPDGYCAPSFNVASAMSTSKTSLSVTFDAPPEMFSATTLSNYTVTGLSLSGTPTLSGMTVSLATASQTTGENYLLTVSGVTRATNLSDLTNATASFTGR